MWGQTENVRDKGGRDRKTRKQHWITVWKNTPFDSHCVPATGNPAFLCFPCFIQVQRSW